MATPMFIASLILILQTGETLVMPFPKVGPKSWNECQSVGFAASEYADSLADESGHFIVAMPDGSKELARTGGWSCIPVEWYTPK